MDHRKIDALVAEHVMGQHRTGDCGLGDETCPGRYEPMVRGPCLQQYTNDIAAAWAVVDRWHGDVEVRRQNGWWRVVFYEPSYEHEHFGREPLPLAICLAALKAKGIEVPE